MTLHHQRHYPREQSGSRLRVQDCPSLRNTLAAVGSEAGSLPDGLQAATAFIRQIGEISFPNVETVADDHETVRSEES